MLMLTKKEARELASKLTNRKIPQRSALSKWTRKGLLDTPIEQENLGKAGGRRNFYWHGFPVEIATVCDLKSEYQLGQISWPASMVRRVVKEGEKIDTTPEELRNKLKSESVQGDIKYTEELYQEQEDKVVELMENKDEFPVKDIKILANMMEVKKRAEIVTAYIEIFADKLEKYNKLPEVDLKKAANNS